MSLLSDDSLLTSSSLLVRSIFFFFFPSVHICFELRDTQIDYGLMD